VQYAMIAGGSVIAVDVHEEKLALARELGADVAIDASTVDAGERIRELGGVDQAIVTAVTPAAFEQAYASLRRGGTLVFVGLPRDNAIRLPIFETVLNGITVKGSIVGTRQDLREVFELHAAGRTRVVVEEHSLDEVNECIERVDAGEVPARIVLVP
jgi:propanol-preferring alcohol dehydrogenase